jgi:hypothetical protein
MGLADAIREFSDSSAGQAALAVLVVGLLDLILTVLAALRDDNYEPGEVGRWLRVQLAGQILPIWVLLFVGYYARGLQFAHIPLLLAAGVGAAGAYVIEEVAAIVRLWGPGRKKVAEPDPDIYSDKP